MKRMRVKVHGEVQGVFFRDTVSREAESAGVAGWVLNASDGTVEAVFEGEDDAVDRLLDVSRRGPARAEVEQVDVEGEEPEGLSGFDVR